MSKRILAVDDSKTMRDTVGFTLRGARYDVVEANDGQDALDKLNGSSVDLVMTGVSLPKLDGIGLVEGLRGDPAHRSTPIPIFTTESEDSRKNEGRAAGATAWIVKPFHPARLVKSVQKVWV